ncbi:hypothetical protein BN2475_770011 [Paraburkholderia ribeironis]|uniref:Uncharacterized protein n=1 Tax=Paraburkholderia ribeironis TaxID=1247936 RepID=A0A1N7SJK1_9BURK|nr:hypothetical protein BN2475_770011 [Paraburkholderia ribeironis]
MARTRNSCRSARVARRNDHHGAAHALRASVVPPVRRHARRARAVAGRVRRAGRGGRRRPRSVAGSTVQRTGAGSGLRRCRAVPLSSRRRVRAGRAGRTCGRGILRLSGGSHGVQTRVIPTGLHAFPEPSFPPELRKMRRAIAFSAKIDRFFTYLQGVLRYCPSAPFLLDRH